MEAENQENDRQRRRRHSEDVSDSAQEVKRRKGPDGRFIALQGSRAKRSAAISNINDAFYGGAKVSALDVVIKPRIEAASGVLTEDRDLLRDCDPNIRFTLHPFVIDARMADSLIQTSYSSCKYARFPHTSIQCPVVGCTIQNSYSLHSLRAHMAHGHKYALMMTATVSYLRLAWLHSDGFVCYCEVGLVAVSSVKERTYIRAI